MSKTKTAKKTNPYDSIPSNATEEQREVIKSWLDLDAKEGESWNPHKNEAKNKILSDYNKTALRKTFETLKIKGAVVEFDGSGDSGQIEQVYVNGKSYSPTDKHVVEGFISHNGTSWCGDGTRTHGWSLNPNLYDALEAFCYSILERSHAGWEINAGSFGNFTFSLNKKDGLTCTLAMNERVEEVQFSEESY